MDYLQPRFQNDPATPYVDENPQAGVSGSIVPAAFFNEVRLELLNLILNSGQTPDSLDLWQVKKAIEWMISEAGGGGGGGGVPNSRLVSTTEGVTGGGALNNDLTLKLAIAALGAIADVADDDILLIWDASATVHKKISKASLAAALNVSTTSQAVFSSAELYASGLNSFTGATAFTVPTLPAISERISVTFQGTTSYLANQLEMNIGGAWVKVIDGVTSPYVFGEGSGTPTWGGNTSVEILHSTSANKTWAVPFMLGTKVATPLANGVWNGQIRTTNAMLRSVAHLTPLNLA